MLYLADDLFFDQREAVPGSEKGVVGAALNSARSLFLITLLSLYYLFLIVSIFLTGFVRKSDRVCKKILPVLLNNLTGVVCFFDRWWVSFLTG